MALRLNGNSFIQEVSDLCVKGQIVNIFAGHVVSIKSIPFHHWGAKAFTDNT